MSFMISLPLLLVSLFISVILVKPNPNKINNISFSVYFYFVVSTIIGALIVTFSSEKYDLPSYFILEGSVSYGLLIISVCYFFYVLTIAFTQYFMNRGNGGWIYDNFVACIKEHDSLFVIKAMKLGLLSSILVLAYYLFLDDSIPLRQLLLGVDTEQIYNSRLDLFNKGFLYFAIKKLFFGIAVIASLYFVATQKINFYTVLSVCNAILFCFLQTEKGPLMLFFIAIFMVGVLCGHKYSSIKILMSILFSMILLSCLYYFLYSSKDIASILNGILSRVFIQQVSGVFLSFQTFGNEIDFDYGRNIFPKLFSVFSSGNEDAKIVAEYLAERYLPELYFSGSVKNINGMYAMDAWASFGMLGCIITSIILAFYSVFTYHFFLRREKTPLSISFYTFFSIFNISFITNAGVAIFSPFAILYLLIFKFFVFMNKKHGGNLQRLTC